MKAKIRFLSFVCILFLLTTLIANAAPATLTVFCPTNITNTATGPGATVFFTATSSGGTGTVTITATPPSGSMFPIGTTTVNTTASDSAKNTANCSFTVTVLPQATTPINLYCSSNITVNASGPSGATVFFNITVTGGCSSPLNISASPASGSAFPFGTTTVLATASDSCADSANCSFTVTVVRPQIILTLPANITNNATSASGATVFFTATASGGCSQPSAIASPASGSTFPIGTTIVNVMSSDTCGDNTNKSFTVTVVRPQIILTLPANITNNATSDSGATVFFTATASGGCGQPTVNDSPASGSTFPIGTTTVNVMSGDTCGDSTNGSFTVTVVRPQISLTVPTNITNTATSANGATVFFTATASGGCSQPSVSATPASGSTFSIGTTTVNVTASDTCGDSTNKSFTVTVLPQATTPINLTCSSNITVNASGPNGATVFFTVTATGGCSSPLNISASPASGSAFPFGTTTVSATASDSCADTANCSFTVTVVRPPIILSIPTNLTVNATSSNGATVFFTATASGGCSQPSVSASPASGSAFAIGTTTVNVTASDTCGDSTNKSFTVTVNPQPTITNNFPNGMGSITLQYPNGQTETVLLTGPITIQTTIGPLGQTSETSSNGLDEAQTQMTQLNQSGTSSLGPVQITLDPNHPTLGQIQENQNNTPGILDVPPFTPSGTATSFFDVFCDVNVGGQTFHPVTPPVMEGIMTHEPPALGDTFTDVSPGPIQLLDANNNPTGIFLTGMQQTPNQAQADLSVTTTAGATSPPQGQPVTFTLVLSNGGPNSVTANITVSNYFPAGLEYVTDNSGGAYDAATGIWTVPGLAASNSVTISITVKAIGPGLQTNTLTVAVPLGYADNVPGNNTSTAFVTVGNTLPEADLGLANTAGIPNTDLTNLSQISVTVGQTVLFTMTVTNYGPSAVSNTITISNFMPAGLQYAGAASTSFFTFGGGTWLDSFGLVAGQTASLIISALATNAGTYTNVAVVSTTGTSDPNPANNTGSVVVQISGQADLAVGQAVTTNSIYDTNIFLTNNVTVPVGAQVVFVLGFTNYGPASPVTVVTVSDLLPPGFKFVTDSSGTYGDTYNPTSGIWTIPWIVNDAQYTLLITAQATNVGTYTNTAVANVPPGLTDPNLSNNTNSVMVTIRPPKADLAMGKSASAKLVNIGQQVVFTLTVTNLGSDIVYSPITVSDLLPAGFQYVSDNGVSNYTGVYNASAGTWTFGGLGGFFPVNSLKITATAMTAGTYTNTAQVNIPPGVNDPNTNNNLASAVVTVIRASQTAQTNTFPNGMGSITLQYPSGQTETVPLTGPITIQTGIGPLGQTSATSGNGLDEVQTQMTQLNQSGTSSLGPVTITLDPNHPTLGQIQENQNNTPGTLDVPPFTPSGTATSFFDVFCDVNVGGQEFYPSAPIPIQGVLTNVPPGPGNTYSNSASITAIQLLDANGNPTGIFLTGLQETPSPLPNTAIFEVDTFSNSQTQLTLKYVSGQTETVPLTGQMTIQTTIGPLGQTTSTSTSGLDEAPTLMTLLNLTGTSSLGAVTVTLDPNHPTVGQIQENQNNTPGILDVPPFTATGTATSFFDVFADITIGGQTYYPAQPSLITGTITHKPPGPGDIFTNSAAAPIPLLDAKGNPTGISLLGWQQVPIPATLAPGYWLPQNLLPPPGTVYISPGLFFGQYPNGIVIRDLQLRGFTQNFPPPALGAVSNLVISAQVVFDLSSDGGNTFQTVTATATLTLELQLTEQTGAGSYFNLQMLQLVIAGGNLPGGLMVKETPNLPSTGQTTIQPSEGGYRISSFFDIFTEVSLDGGSTWSPAPQPGQLELRNDPAAVAPVPEPTELLPPPVGVFTDAGLFAGFAPGLLIKNIQLALFNFCLPPPLAGTSNVYSFNAQIEMQVSTNGGTNYQTTSTTGAVQVKVTADGAGSDGFYDTQMTSLNLPLPGGAETRISPTLPSLGATQISNQPDGSYRISSFFDIFTEISVDGGGTWSPATNGAARVQLMAPALEAAETSSNFPPAGPYLGVPGLPFAVYANGVIISNLTQQGSTQSFAPPGPGVSQPETFDSTVSLMISLDGGKTYTQVAANAVETVQVTNRPDLTAGNARFYDTQMTQLDLSGGTLPPNVKMRQSPTLPSLGRTSERTNSAGGGYFISSFFDVFTELSLDGGQTWSPTTTGPGAFNLSTNNQVAPILLVCSTNITVNATSSSGATVFFSLNASGGCHAPVTITANPPSGSVFPIGTNTVNVSAADSCANVANCSFTVIVVPTVTSAVFTRPAKLSSGAFNFSFSYTPSTSFTILSTTNPALPMSNWSVLGAATENPPGQFQFTDPRATNNPHLFYRIRSP